MSPNPQVKKNHYFTGYDNLPRFMSYYQQIDIARQLNSEKILEIGVGNKTVSNYLRFSNFSVNTCDFDKNLGPDYVADVRQLPFRDGEYDAIFICQVLEHLPFEDFELALQELSRVTSKNVVISLPYSSLNFEFYLRLPFLNRLIGSEYLHSLFRVPRFYKKHKFDGQHYWEIGKKDYPLSLIRSKILIYFSIERELSPIINPYHYFFILRKRIF